MLVENHYFMLNNVKKGINALNIVNYIWVSNYSLANQIKTSRKSNSNGIEIPKIQPKTTHDMLCTPKYTLEQPVIIGNNMNIALVVWLSEKCKIIDVTQVADTWAWLDGKEKSFSH